MLVNVIDAMDIQESGRNQRAGARLGGRRPFACEFHLKSAFLARLPQGCLLRLLIQLYMPAQRKPLVKLSVMHQEHPALLNDEYGHGKIDRVMDVRHGA